MDGQVCDVDVDTDSEYEEFESHAVRIQSSRLQRQASLPLASDLVNNSSSHGTEPARQSILSPLSMEGVVLHHRETLSTSESSRTSRSDDTGHMALPFTKQWALRQNSLSSTAENRGSSLTNLKGGSSMSGFSLLVRIINSQEPAVAGSGESDSQEETLFNELGQVFKHKDLDKIAKFFIKARDHLLEDNMASETATTSESESIQDEPEQLEFDSDVADVPILDKDRRAPHGVVCFGSVAMDLITLTTAFPTENSHQKGQNLKSLPGGKAANEAVACGRLNCPTYLVGRVGNEDFGKEVVNAVKPVAITDGVTFDTGFPTGLCMILKADGGSVKTTTTCLAANEQMGAEDVRKLEEIFIGNPNVKIVLIDFNINMDAAILAAKSSHENRKLVAVRPTAVKQMSDFPNEMWNYADILIVNEFEAPILLGFDNASNNPYGISKPLGNLQQASKAASLIFQAHKRLSIVIITTGFGNVCRLRMPTASKIHERGFDITECDIAESFETSIVIPHFYTVVVDVIGAADAFLGAVCSAVAHGCPVQHALVWGSAGAAISVLAEGAQSSLPTLEEMLIFLQRNSVGVHAPGMIQNLAAWPSSKPEISQEMQELQELLNHGAVEEFQDKLMVLEGRDVLNAAIDFQGQTLLHLAVLYGDLECVCTLLRHDADFYVKDRYGRTPLDRCHELCLSNSRMPTYGWNKLVLLAVSHVDKLLTDRISYDPHFTSWDQLNESMPKEFEEFHDEANWATMLLAMIMLPWSILERSKDGNQICNNVSAQFEAMLELAAHKFEEMLDFYGDDNIKLPKHVKLAIQDGFVKTKTKNDIRVLHGAAYSGKVKLLQNICNKLKLPIEEEAIRVRPEFKSAFEDSSEHVGGANDDRPRKWLSMVDQALVDVKFRGSLHFSAIGHAATAGGNDRMVKYLTDNELNPHAIDQDGYSCIDYVDDSWVKQQMQDAGFAHDVFISVGHTPATDESVNDLVQNLKSLGLKVWWDRGHRDAPVTDPVEDDRLPGDENNNVGLGIRPGRSWTLEIESAMLSSKACIVVLTQKWLSSQFCLAEAKLALSFSKPIFTVMPPVPPSESASISDVKEEIIQFAIGHLQNFDLSETRDVALSARVKSIAEAITSCQTRQVYNLGSIDMSRAISDADEVRLLTPPDTRPGWTATDYVLLCSGADNSEGGYNSSFAKVITDALLSKHVAVAQGLKCLTGPNGPSDTFWDNILQRAGEALMVLILFEQQTDTIFLNRVMELAGQKKTKCIFIPYTQCIRDRNSGLNYSANFMITRTCCFTNWMGSDSLRYESPVFQQIFSDGLMRHIDELAENKDDKNTYKDVNSVQLTTSMKGMETVLSSDREAHFQHLLNMGGGSLSTYALSALVHNPPHRNHFRGRSSESDVGAIQVRWSRPARLQRANTKTKEGLRINRSRNLEMRRASSDNSDNFKSLKRTSHVSIATIAEEMDCKIPH